MRVATLLVAVLLLGGCSRTGYYLQAARGQLELLSKREPVSEVIANPATDQPLRRQLQLADSLRQYAIKRLGLADNRTFTQYADIGRRHVVWNLVAAPEFAVSPRTWCFPVAGCVAYKGFFSEQDARQEQASVAAEGFDTFVYGVSAYSTLGWFDDPLINTFIHFPEPALAGMIFHELAHQVVYFKDDSAFNEAFATAVEFQMVEDWFTRQENTAALDALTQRRKAHQTITDMVLTYRERLSTAYALDTGNVAKRQSKVSIIDEMKRSYAELKSSGVSTRFYDWWFSLPLNNAHLLGVSTYYRLDPAITRIMQRYEGDLIAFIEHVRKTGPSLVSDDSKSAGD